MSRRIERADDGYELRLGTDERQLLASLPSQLISILSDIGDEATEDLPEPVKRILPPAYLTDSTAESGYIALARDDLVSHHRAALEILVATAEATRLDEEQLLSWLGAINNLRLVLGSVLEVTDEDAEPRLGGSDEAEWIAYYYLGALQYELIELVSEGLPEPRNDADEQLPGDPWGEPPGGLRWDGTPLPGSGEQPPP